ncbi:hypothetical protein JXA85_08200, partial [Candidatus Woesearchaeota archaeon]|nr:hypothetical protein [Candidatus Woesearchaeota archaeon]
TPEIDDESYLERFRYVQETFSGVPTFIMGGEPFLKPKRLVEVLKIAEEYAVPVILGSNFSIDIVETARINKFYEELLHILKSHKNKIAVWCSLEDTVSEHHDLLRKQGGFDLSIRNAKNLMESGIPVTANLFINAQNYPRFQQMLDYLMGMGFEGAAVHFHTYVFNAKNPFPQYTLTESHREKASKVLEKVLKEKHYFDFTRGMTSESARMFHPGYLSKVFNVKKCPTANRMLSFDHRMLPLIPCSFGGEVYCNYDHPEHGKIGCGLWLPALYAAAVRGGVGAIRSLMTEAFSRNK